MHEIKPKIGQVTGGSVSGSGDLPGILMVWQSGSKYWRYGYRAWNVRDYVRTTVLTAPHHTGKCYKSKVMVLWASFCKKDRNKSDVYFKIRFDCSFSSLLMYSQQTTNHTVLFCVGMAPDVWRPLPERADADFIILHAPWFLLDKENNKQTHKILSVRLLMCFKRLTFEDR